MQIKIAQMFITLLFMLFAQEFKEKQHMVKNQNDGV